MPDKLAPVDTLTDDEFDAAFDKMAQEEYARDNSDDSVEEKVEPEQPEDVETTDEDDGFEEEELEQPTDEAEEEEDNADEQDTDSDDAETQDDSTEDDSEEQTEDEPVEVEFDFSNIPMDQELPFDIPANGMTTKATINQLITGFQKGLNYTKHMQQLKPFRNSIGIMEDNDISENDLNLLAEAKNGSKEAFSKLMSDAKIDPIDIESEGNEQYTPKDHSKNLVDPEMEDAKNIIAADKEYLPATQEALNTMPQDFYDAVSSSPNNMLSLHKDVKEGIYAKVMPEVMKLQALYGIQDTMKLYVDTARNMFGGEDSPKETKEPTKPKSKPRADKIKVKSTTSKKGSSKPSVAKSLDDMDDDEFDKEFQRLYGDITVD